jgi:N-acetylglutamate synthase-like GNAT family acetyltransferase
MELPIVNAPAASETDALIRTIKKGDLLLASWSATPADFEGGRTLIRPDRPDVARLNRAVDVHVPDGMAPDAVIDALEAAFADAGATCAYAQSAGADFTPDLADAFRARGWQPTAIDILVMSALALPESIDDDLQVAPARALIDAFHELAAAAHGSEEAADTDVEELDEPRLDCYLARRDHRAEGAAATVSEGDIGIVRTLITRPDHTDDCVIDRLLTDLFDLCSRAQFRVVAAPVAPHETRKRDALERFGMSRIGAFHRFTPPR